MEDLEQIAKSLYESKDRPKYIIPEKEVEKIDFKEIRGEILDYYASMIIPMALFCMIFTFLLYPIIDNWAFLSFILLIIFAIIYALFLSKCINQNIFNTVDVYIEGISLTSLISFFKPFRSYDICVKTIEKEEFKDDIIVKSYRRPKLKENHFYKLYFSPYTGKFMFSKEIFF